MDKTVHRLGSQEITFVTQSDLDDRYSQRLRRNGGAAKWKPDDHTLVAAQMLGSGDFFVDLGANYGTFSIPVSLISGARGLCVEALRSNIPVLHEAIQANDLDTKLDWLLGAVTSQSGEARISGESAFGTVKDSGERVLSWALDDLIDEINPSSLSLIKMDIEGMEMAALDGAPRLWERYPDVTWIFEANAAHCFGKGHRPQDLLARFEAQGYLLYLSKGGKLARRSSKDFQESGVSDYFATKRPLEEVLDGSLFGEHSEDYRLAETKRSLTKMLPAYGRSALEQRDLAPPYIGALLDNFASSAEQASRVK